MRSRVAVGIALALTVALAGCQGNREQAGGGGGGTGGSSMQPQGGNRPGGEAGPAAGNTAGTQGSLGGAGATNQGALPRTKAGAEQPLQTATRHASAARASVGQKDWKTAQNEIARVKADLRAAEARATGDVRADMTAIRQQADRAERSIQQHSATAKTDLDRLVKHLNQVAVREQPVRAGGGKPAER